MTDNPSIVAMFENIDVYGRNPPSDLKQNKYICMTNQIYLLSTALYKAYYQTIQWPMSPNCIIFLLSTEHPLKGNFSQKWKTYHRFRILRRAEGKIFKFQNLQENPAELFHHVFTPFLLLRFMLTFTNLWTQLTNFYTHFNKPRIKFTGMLLYIY